MPRFSYAEAVQRGWISPAEAKKAQAAPKKTRQASPHVAEKSKNKDIEGQEQAQLVGWFDANYAQFAGLLIHIPNGGSRKNAFEGWRLKQQGVRAGVSDLFLPVAKGEFHGLWMEFKATPPNDAKVSPSQQEWINNMQKQGYSAHVCKGLNQAQTCIRDYFALDKHW